MALRQNDGLKFETQFLDIFLAQKCKEKIEELSGKVEELKRQRSAMTPNDTFDQQSALNVSTCFTEVELIVRDLIMWFDFRQK